MAVIFFDSSALVRRFDATEPGSHAVRSLCRRLRAASSSSANSDFLFCTADERQRRAASVGGLTVEFIM